MASDRSIEMPDLSSISGTTGHLAGLGTALCWVFTSFLFAAASRAIGSGAVNLVRSILAMGLLLLLNGTLLGVWWPQASVESLAWLAASGIVGLALGDQFLFAALVDIGPRLATLLMTLAPGFAALVAWLLLGEIPSSIAILGMCVTLAGIAWVVRERPVPGDRPLEAMAPGRQARGMLLGVLAAAGQGIGYAFAKMGMLASGEAGGAVDPLAAQLVRITAAASGLALAWMLFGPRRWLAGADWQQRPPRLSRRTMAAILGGTVLGPVGGVWLSLVAVQRLEAGVAATLTAMSPVLVLPFARIIDRERISLRALLGAAIAIAGVAILAFANAIFGMVAAVVDGLP